MRKIMMASAAFLMTAGIACAQTTTPAPQGATNAPVQTPANGSPGKTGPNMTSGGNSMAPGIARSNDSASPTTPAPDGATNAPVETPTGGTPGKTAPAGGNSQ